MALDLLYRLVMFVALLLAQVLILNHVHIFGVATPLLYVYFVVTFHRNFPRWIILLSSFLLGLLIDIFSSTPGLAAGCMTLVAFVQPYLVELMAPRDSAEDLEVSAATFGWSKFSTLSILIVSLYCLVFFALEAFSFFEWLAWMERAVASGLLTWVLMMGLESVRSK